MVLAQDQHPLMDELPGSVVQPRVLTPMLGIFPGTTAAYAALEFMKHVKELSEGDRKRIALVYIDTDDQRPELIAFRNEHAGMFNEYIIRIAVPANIRYIPRVEQNGDLTEPHTYIGKKLPEYFATGARGVRNNGHVAACHDYQKIFEQLNDALCQITSREANEEQGQPNELQVNIASFIGGGTGSGIIADLACMMRELLIQKGVEQRINLLCILPTNVSGGTDIGLRRSNAVACLMEVIALGMAAKGNYYHKFMRANMQRLSQDPIANEVFLIGDAGLKDPKEIARIMGLDLFHRTLDASSVGATERSVWGNRTSLGDTDDRGLPTMFGTSCPLEVRFPAQATALAFAQIAASHLLPLLASYQPQAPRASEADRRQWQQEWRLVGRRDENANDTMVVVVPQFARTDFDGLDAEQVEILWGRMGRMKKTIDERVKDVMTIKKGRELERIRTGGESTPTGRIQYWQTLFQEYDAVLEELREKDIPVVPDRPTELENRVLHPPIWAILQGDLGGELFAEYNAYLQIYAEAERHRQLRTLLEDLIARVQNKLKETFSWSVRVNANQEAPRLRDRGKTSAAWRGQLDSHHLFQQHIFDLPLLCTQNGHNIAVERLYGWATVGDSESSEVDIDYHPFLSQCITYMTGTDELAGLDKQSAKRLTQRVVGFFQQYYHERFRDTNLFELLEHTLPPVSPDGKSLEEQQEQVLTEQLKKLKKQMVDLVIFDERVGGAKCIEALKKQVFLGWNWHDGQQESMLKDIAAQLNLSTYGELLPEFSLDPHRLQISYGKHAISLSTIPDFYYDRNSAMEQYGRSQQQWQLSQRQGPRPPHSCDQLEQLVTDANALGYIDPKTGAGVSLVNRLIRLP